jgi:hypothetical protein
MFVLQHLAHHHLLLKQPAYCVLLDVAAAYDTTRHDTLVETLLSLDFPEHLVRGIHGMYEGLQYQVAVNGKVAPPFPVGIGVKQGCPLSPILYNLYVQPLSGQLAALDIGPQFPGVPGHHPDYHYADDIAEVDSAVPGIQSLLDHTVERLGERHLTLGVPKCIAMLLGCSPARTDSMPLALTVNNETLAKAPASGARYLGLMYDSAATAATMAKHRATCFTSSYYAATSRMQAAEGFPCAIPTFIKLLHTVMEPAGLYGCELWGLLSIPGLWGPGWSLEDFYRLADPLEVQRCALIRQWLRLPASTPGLPLLHELGCEPLVHTFVRRAVRFYNTLLDLAEGSVYRGVLTQNIQDAFATPAAHNYIGALDKVLRLILPRANGITRGFRDGQPIDMDEVDQALQDRYQEYIQECSLALEGPCSRIGLYFRVVAKHALGVVPGHYYLRLPHGVLVRLLRFRLGCHHLRINTGRWHHPPLPRSQRHCQRCTLSVIDDEAHCLLSCQHPDLVDAREVLDTTGAVDLSGITSYSAFWDRYNAHGSHAITKYVATCVRVAWKCHQFGGLPAALAALDFGDVDMVAADYLDYFDSTSESDDAELVEVVPDGL